MPTDPILKRVARTVLPEPAFTAGKRMFLSRQARLFRDRCSRRPDVASKVDEALASKYFRLDQKRGEIVALLELVGAQAPVRVCEIGGRLGGSLALFAQMATPDARLLSVDIDYRPGQKEAIASFGGPGQRIVSLAADSHAPETVRWVADWFGPDRIDFLFIDGDHSFDGVSRDFDDFAPLVRPGGIVAFHDIVQDSRTRHGVVTSSDVGQVPEFWTRLKASGRYRTEEYVESWEQDGFGIGVVHWDGVR